MLIIYRQAAKILQMVEQKKGNARSLALQKDVQKKKATFALVCETMKYAAVIDRLIEELKILKENPLWWSHMVKVLIYDMLFGKGIKSNRGFCQELKKKYGAMLTKRMKQIKSTEKAKSKEDLVPYDLRIKGRLPRYVRVNTLKKPVNEVLKTLKQEGYVLSSTARMKIFDNYEKQKNDLRTKIVEAHKKNRAILKSQKTPTVNTPVNMPSKETNAKDKKRLAAQLIDVEPLRQQLKRLKGPFWVDPHVRSMLVFPPGTQFNKHKLFKENALILQDKSSCLPAVALLRASGSDHSATELMPQIIDACAAPGNKLSLLAALTSNNTNLIAVERDTERFEIMRKRMGELGVQHVTYVNDSFLNLDPNDPKYKDTTGILVDPSCTGSGILSRPEMSVRKGQRPAPVAAAADAEVPYPDPAKKKQKTDDSSAKPVTTTASKDNNNNQCEEISASLATSLAKKKPIGGSVASGRSATASAIMASSSMGFPTVEDDLKEQRELQQAAGSLKEEDEGGEKLGLGDKKGGGKKQGRRSFKRQIVSETLADKDRIKALVEVQTKLLRHAFNFPAVRRIVYSTCSLLQQENENVVRAVLSDEWVKARFELINVMPNWSTRAFPIFENASHCIRCDPKNDHTHGFFVAMFERKFASPLEMQMANKQRKELDERLRAQRAKEISSGAVPTVIIGHDAQQRRKKMKKSAKKNKKGGATEVAKTPILALTSRGKKSKLKASKVVSERAAQPSSEPQKPKPKKQESPTKAQKAEQPERQEKAAPRKGKEEEELCTLCHMPGHTEDQCTTEGIPKSMDDLIESTYKMTRQEVRKGLAAPPKAKLTERQRYRQQRNLRIQQRQGGLSKSEKRFQKKMERAKQNSMASL